MPAELADVLRRLERLESQNDGLRRQNRRLKWAGAFGVALAATLGLASCQSNSQGPAAQGTVEVEKLVLKGPDGKMQALLASGPKGPALILFGPGEPATPLIGLSVDYSEGAPSLSLYDGRGKGRIQMKVARDGESVLAMTDDQEKERARLSVNGPGPGLTLWDDADRVRVVLTATKTASGLSLLGRDKSAVLLENGDDAQRLMFLNSRELPRVGLAVTRQGPAFGLFDDHGRELFSKP
jgi:hypothetical protein